MNVLVRISKFIELSRWFNRKSQHYVLGNWLCYVDAWDYKNACWNKAYFKYLMDYPMAYCKFMWYSRADW